MWPQIDLAMPKVPTLKNTIRADFDGGFETTLFPKCEYGPGVFGQQNIFQAHFVVFCTVDTSGIRPQEAKIKFLGSFFFFTLLI